MSLIRVTYRNVGGRQFTRVWLIDWELHHRQMSLLPLATINYGVTSGSKDSVLPVKTATGKGFFKSGGTY